ncbi:hypothetical protein ACMYLX_23155, partial [Salmonella enterica subsp. enterica serovar Enteritidis]|uniref:hypothetical protein n=1 Tax=Salmonella enterica TaxID=28901 RepID=UPI0039E7E5D0
PQRENILFCAEALRRGGKMPEEGLPVQAWMVLKRRMETAKPCTHFNRCADKTWFSGMLAVWG